MIQINEIMQALKHRYPFLLIDRILEIEEGTRVRGIKCVTINEDFFNGHFPEEPVMPGVLIIESMAQLSSFLNGPQNIWKGYLTSIIDALFRKPVVPGDTLVLEVILSQRVRNLIKVKGKAYVGEEWVAKAELGFIILEKNGKQNTK